MGRTGRKSPGSVVSFITKGTRDETNYYVSQQRLSQAKRTVKRFSKNTNPVTKNVSNKDKTGLDKFL